jgi:L-threonylcarbamoyladenylate synthase
VSRQLTTQTIAVNAVAPEPAAIKAAAAIIRGGGLVAFPTETVYGLGANALDAAAVAKIFAAKGRPTTDPLIVHIATLARLDAVAEQIPTLARELAAAFWPGALTLVLKRRSIIPPNVSAGRDTVAVRMPAHPVALALCAAAGVPIAAPSANMFTRTSPTTAADVREDLAGRIDLLLDGGPTQIGLESTVLDLTQDPPAILRPGGVALEDLRAFVPNLVFVPKYVAEESAAAQPGPGMLLKHYSPRAELLLFVGASERALAHMRAHAERARAAGRSVGIMAPNEDLDQLSDLGAQLIALGPRRDLPAIGRRIFGSMRELDRRGVDLILVREFSRERIGLAIWDRLLRAAEGRVIDADEPNA